MAERILVIQLAKLGDFIQSTPLLANIRRRWPSAALVMAAEQAAVREAAALSPLVDEVFRVEESGPPPEGFFRAVFVLNSHPRAAALAQGVDHQEHYGPTLAGDRLIFDEARLFLLELVRSHRPLGRFNLVDVWNSLLPEARPEPLVWPKPTLPAPERGRELKVGFQLGSRNHLRRWPVENFVSLAGHLAEAGLPIRPVLLGSPEEKALGRKYEKLAGSNPPVLNLIGSTNLKGLAGALAGLDLLVSGDTGSLHLAAALQTPALALFFGPAFGPETGPYGSGHIIYQAAAPCSPCRESGSCGLRQCREMPDPALAARLAEALLKKDDAFLAREISLPPSHRLWRSGLDSFGLSLEPLGRPLLSETEFTALLMTALGRRILRPAYEDGPEAVLAALKAYSLPPGPWPSAGRAFQSLVDRTFPQYSSAAAELYSKVAERSSEFGLKLALT